MVREVFWRASIVRPSILDCRWGAGRPARPPSCWPGEARLCRKYCAVPPELDFVPLLLPGTDVPSFPVSPLRGWSNSAAHFFAGLGVATQTRPRPSTQRKPRLRRDSRPRLSKPSAPRKPTPETTAESTLKKRRADTPSPLHIQYLR